MRGSGRSVGGQGVVIGDHLEVRCSLPKEMGISRSEIFRKKEKQVSYRCSLPSPLQKRSSQWFLKLFGMFTLNSPVILGVEARREPEEIFKESEFMLGTKPKEVLLVLPKSKKTRKLKIWRTSMQSFVILGSPLQWWWQRASIRHFVFLFSSKFHS